MIKHFIYLFLVTSQLYSPRLFFIGENIISVTFSSFYSKSETTLEIFVFIQPLRTITMTENSQLVIDQALATMENDTNDLIQKIKDANGKSKNPRLSFLLGKFIDYFKAFSTETKLRNDEFYMLLDFLTECGQNSTATRQELYLLSDILGVSSLLDVLNNPKPANATKSTVMGPFHTDDGPNLSNGESISSPGRGECCLMICSVSDTSGKPIEGVKIDVWETDATGRYDNQYENRDKPDMRAVLTSDADGKFYFRCVRPVSYTVPNDGPVGHLLENLNREAYRPAHIHFLLTDPQKKYENLVTALFIRGDPHEENDAVFGVRPELIVDINKVQDESMAHQYNVDPNDWLIKYDFVLTSTEKVEKLR